MTIFDDKKTWRKKIDEYEQIIQSNINERNSIQLKLNNQADIKLKLKHDEIGYNLIDQIANKFFCEIMDMLIKQKRAELILNIENYGERKKKIRQKIKAMIKQIKKLELPNKIFLHNKLIIIFDNWQHQFQSYGYLPELKECYYAKMKARMWCNWFLIWE